MGDGGNYYDPNVLVFFMCLCVVLILAPGAILLFEKLQKKNLIQVDQTQIQ